MYKKLLIAAAAAATLLSATAQAAIVRLTDPAAFIAGSGLITFSEKPLGTVDPVYAPGDYGGPVGGVTVSFGGFFTGQSLGGASPPCPAGATLTGCVIGNPTGPLSLDAAAPDARIVNDGAFPTSPTLSGSPTFNGPIALLFDVDVAGVALDVGFLDAVGGTGITAFARDGSVLGTVTSLSTGIEFLGLVTSDGTAQIGGLLFYLVGAEPAGFNIDNVRFGRAGEVVVPTPEPATMALFGLGLAGLAAARRRKAA